VTKGYDNLPMNSGVILDLPLFEGAGALVHDNSKYHNNGTIIDASWVTAASGLPCLSFDGLDDYINFGNVASLKPTDALTIESWFKSTTPVTAPGSIVTITGIAPSLGVDEVSDTKITVRFTISRWYGGTCRTFAFTTTAYGNYLDRWVHLMGVRDVTTGKICAYIDKIGFPEYFWAGQVLCYDGTYPDIHIGRRPHAYLGAPYYLKGIVALPRIYNRAPSLLEVQSRRNRKRHWFGV